MHLHEKKETKMALPSSALYQSIFGFYRDQPVHETMFVHRDESGGKPFVHVTEEPPNGKTTF